MSKEIVIEVRNLVKNFTLGDRTLRVLDGIDLQIHSGEFVIFFGPSGSGKTTLLNMIAGLDNITSGQVLIRGESISRAKSNVLACHRLSKVGMVFQDFNLINAMSALENVALPLIFNNISMRQRLKRAELLLKEMGLEERICHRPVELSGGEQQRVAIARAMVNNPWIFLIDEPTGNLDSESANEIMGIIVKLCRESKRTILLVTHNPNYLGLADRVLSMQDGKIINEMRDEK